MSTTSSRRNEVLFGLLAPVVQNISREYLDGFGRISLVKTAFSPDGVFLDCFIISEQDGTACAKALREYEPMFRKAIADAKVLGRMPKVRFKYDSRQQNAATVEDIIREIEQKYDLTGED